MTSAAEPLDLAGVRVLIAEDHDDIRALFEMFLVSCGAVVLAVPSGAQAFDVFGEFRPDILVSDISMPDGDGYSLVRRVRALPEEAGGRTPVIALSGLMDEAASLAAGFNLHLLKPIHPVELAAKLQDLLAPTTLTQWDARPKGPA